MTQEEVRRVVAEVVAEQVRLAPSAEAVAMSTVTAFLRSFGFEEEERQELKKDFVHLRRWRVSVEQTVSYSWRAVVTVVVGGFVGAVWLGFKILVGK